MESFTVMLEIYNLSMVLLVTPIASPPFCFRIRTTAYGPNAMVINRLPDLTWKAEGIQKKYFTLEIIQRLGALIELKSQHYFYMKSLKDQALYKGQNALLNIRSKLNILITD